MVWEPSSDDRGVAEYRVSLDSLDLRTTTATTASFSGLACGRSYVLKVVAADAAGNVSPSASVSASTSPCASSSADTQPPTMPSGLVRRDGTSTSVTLSWNASTDNVGVAGYGIYRAGTKVADANVTGYEVQGLTCATSYTFAVDAVDVNGLRSARATVIAVTEPCPGTTAPSAPTNLASQSRTETSITLSWQASTGASGYRVYRDGMLRDRPPRRRLRRPASTAARVIRSASRPTTPPEATARVPRRSFRAARSDVVPPSTASSLLKGAINETTISLSWATASDNVAVVGYPLYLGSAVSVRPPRPRTLLGAHVRTNYTLGVEAYDAAGNRSQRVALYMHTLGTRSNRAAVERHDRQSLCRPLRWRPSCTRSSTLVTYDQALTGGNVCGPGTGRLGYSTNGWNNACKAASASNTASGTIIGVKAGTYQAGADGHLVKDTDCSGGQGADVNPNAVEQGVSTGGTAAWARYVCADGPSKNVNFNVGGIIFMYANFHIVSRRVVLQLQHDNQLRRGWRVQAQIDSNVQLLGGTACARDAASPDCIASTGSTCRSRRTSLSRT